MINLHIIGDLEIGGAERSLHSLLTGGLAQACENHVISLTDQGVFGPRIESLGVNVHCLGLRSERGLLGAALELRKLARLIRPNLIQGWMYHGNLAARLARFGAPQAPKLVWNIRHSLDNISHEKRGTRWTIRGGKMLSTSVDTILYNSNKSRTQHEAFGYASQNGLVIPNGFDTDLWRPNSAARENMRAELGLKEQDILVGFVARFHPMKDLANLLTAVAPIIAQNNRVHLAVVGNGNEKSNPALAALYANIPAQTLHIMGPRNDVQDVLAGFDTFCLSSNSEAFPNVLGEAMACGVVSVATDVGDVRKVLGDTGILVPPSDSEALMAALAKMVAMPREERRNAGKKARKRIVENFSLDATVQRYKSLYTSLMEKT